MRICALSFVWLTTTTFGLCSLVLDRVMGGPSEISINHAQFADKLTTELYVDDNECTSAWGISMAFSLIYPSSVGDTEQQMRTTFGYPSGSQQTLVWEETATRIDGSYEGRCLEEIEEGRDDCPAGSEEPIVEIANSVWIDEGCDLNPDYQAVIKDNLHEIEFFADTAKGIINEWVENSTLGLIDYVFDGDGPLPPGTVLVAVNAICFKATWDDPFEKKYTNQDVFYTGPSRGAITAETHFMHKVFEYSEPFYSHDAVPGFQILQLWFTSNLSMIFALPTGDSSGDVSSTDVLSALPLLSPTYMAVALPKFKFESSYEDDLITALMNLGMTAPFMGGLCIAAGTPCDALVSDVIHKTVIDLNEFGVEAAAASVVESWYGAPVGEPTLFMADHPFQFFIHDSTEELVLFEGRVGNPGIVEGADPPALGARHSDRDFWTANFFVDPVTPDFPEPRDDTAPEPTPAPTPETNS